MHINIVTITKDYFERFYARKRSRRDGKMTVDSSDAIVVHAPRALGRPRVIGHIQHSRRLTVVLIVMLLLLVMAVLRAGRRRFREPVVEAASLAGRQAHRLVPGRELDPFALHLGLVTHDHHEMGPLLRGPEYAPHGRRPLPVALSQPPVGRRFFPVAVHVRQHHGGGKFRARVVSHWARGERFYWWRPRVPGGRPPRVARVGVPTVAVFAYGSAGPGRRRYVSGARRRRARERARSSDGGKERDEKKLKK